jgi:uncharacterized protein (TIRG00374 family)
VISAISLAVVFYFAHPARLVEALKLADYRLVLLVAPVTLAWLLVRAGLWRTLLKDRPTFGQTFFTVGEGYLMNNILPFRLGEVARALLMARKTGQGFWEVFPTIIIERVLDLAFAAGLLLTTLSFVVGAAWAREAALITGAVVLAGLAALYFMARYRETVQGWMDRIFQKVPLLRRLGGEPMKALFDGLAVLTDGRRFLLAVGLMATNWAIALAQYYVLLLAFFPQGKFIWGAFTLAVAAMGVAAPSSPGSVGVYEAAVVGALALFKLNAATALAFALSAHLINYVVTGIVGAIGLAQDGESLAGLYRRAKQGPQLVE